MGFVDTLRKIFYPPAAVSRQPAARPFHFRAMPGGRATKNGDDSFASNTWAFVPPSSHESNWELTQIDPQWFERMRLSPSKLADILIDFSPEVSRALWDYLRMGNAGWEFWAERPNSDAEDERGKQATQAFVDALADRHGSMDVLINRMLLAGFVRGAICAELVLDKRGRMPLELALPDPASIRFRKREDPVIGEVWQPGQWRDGKIVPLDIPTFRYLPIDPMLNVPYGRSIIAPALHVSLFLLGIMHDLRRVIQQQGWPRLDLAIDLEKVLSVAPQLLADGQTAQEYVSHLVDDVARFYATLQPDEAYVHTSDVEINRPVGALDNKSIESIDKVINTLERRITRALKSNSLMMDLGESTSESEANRKYEMYAAGIKSLQHSVETMLGRLLTLALEAQGIQSTVTWRFAELRASERIRDAQADMMEIANERAKYDHGWISQDEASEVITGSPADAPEPRNRPVLPQPTQGDNDGGEALNRNSDDRSTLIDELRAGRIAIANATHMMVQNGYHAPN